MSEIVATIVVASQPPESRLTGMLMARANNNLNIKWLIKIETLNINPFALLMLILIYILQKKHFALPNIRGLGSSLIYLSI